LSFEICDKKVPHKSDSGSASKQTIADAVPGKPADETGVSAAGPLRINNFRLLLTGSVLSNAAMWIMQITLSWLVYDITGSGTLLGTINLTRTAAGICMASVAGLMVDRLNRRKLITIENSVLFTTTFLVGLLIILGHESIAVLFIVAIVNGAVTTLDGTLRQVLMQSQSCKQVGV
jgi:Na+/melibiose symporter-like transporter